MLSGIKYERNSLHSHIIVVVIVALCASSVLIPANAYALEGNFIPNELIVQFRSGLTPDDLEAALKNRNERGSAFLVGPMQILLEDLSFQITGGESPEKKYMRLSAANQSVGVVSFQSVGDSDGMFERLYILHLDGSVDVPAAAAYYQNLPEVEFVEPNYIYSEVGI